MASGLKSGYIQLGAQRVKVRVVRNLHKRETIYGDIDCAKNVIRLAGDVASTQVVDALLHEVGHYVLAECELSHAQWESTASAIGRGFTSFFRDNPEWVSAILSVFREEAKCQPKSTRKQTGTQARTCKRTNHRATRQT